MKYQTNAYEIHLIDEPLFSPNSTDNTRSYELIYCNERKVNHSCAHGLIVGDIESPINKAILLGCGGVTAVHERSLAFSENICFVAAGDSVFALDLPSLHLKWSIKVDFATCFSVYWHSNTNSLITWGEVQICRLSEDGNKLWEFSGADIFTESFEIENDTIKIIDFYKQEYAISIDTGKEK